MIEVTGIRIGISTLDGTDACEKEAVRSALLRRLHLAPDDVTSVERRRRSIDARKSPKVILTFTVRATLRGGANAERALMAKLGRRHDDRGITIVEDHPFLLPSRVTHTVSDRPVVVGAGCAGLFCALALANAGLSPLLVERGDDAQRRSQAVDLFNETGRLDPESNIQFGLGGAGTFSDGKLSTGTKSPAHRLILETLVEAGASPSILWDAKPHVGSDVLPAVVTHVVDRIVGLGGEARFRTRMTGIEVVGGSVTAVMIEQNRPDGLVIEERVPTSRVVVATGHSAHDVFSMFSNQGIVLERKTFAMGVRIEHLQRNIDASLYGPKAGDPSLGAAPYKLVSHLPGGRSAFSFCMCPGGEVVAAASEPGGVVTNGASLEARDGRNANSGLLANVFPEDLPGDDPLEGIRLQRTCEQRAFERGGGDFVAPAQLVGDFLHKTASTGPGSVQPTYARGVSWGTIDSCLPSYIVDTIRTAIPDMNRHLPGFSAEDAVLTGVETRSSSPVRVTRGQDGQSVACRGLFPVGEGAGYAGGIMSAATDGLAAARLLIASLTGDARG